MSGPTSLELQSVSALGGDFWAKFDWNDGQNSFNVVEYGEMLHYDFVGSVKPEGARRSWLQALNNVGLMVQIAEFEVSEGLFRRNLYVHEDGILTDIGGFGGWMSCTGINDVGTVVGAGDPLGSNISRAFIYQDGIMTKLGTLGGDESRGGSINNAGTFVGSSQTEDGFWHAFVYEDGVMRDLGAPEDADFLYVQQINEAGTFVGYYQPTGQLGVRPFVCENGVTRKLNTLGGLEGMALAINDAGTIVGCSDDAEGRRWAVVYEGDEPRNILGSIGGIADEAWGITSDGVIAGHGSVEEAGVVVQRGWVYNGALQKVVYGGGEYEALHAMNGVGQILGWAVFAESEELTEGFRGTLKTVAAPVPSHHSGREPALAPGPLSVPGNPVGMARSTRPGFSE